MLRIQHHFLNKSAAGEVIDINMLAAYNVHRFCMEADLCRKKDFLFCLSPPSGWRKFCCISGIRVARGIPNQSATSSGALYAARRTPLISSGHTVEFPISASSIFWDGTILMVTIPRPSFRSVCSTDSWWPYIRAEQCASILFPDLRPTCALPANSLRPCAASTI